MTTKAIREITSGPRAFIGFDLVGHGDEVPSGGRIPIRVSCGLTPQDLQKKSSQSPHLELRE